MSDDEDLLDDDEMEDTDESDAIGTLKLDPGSDARRRVEAKLEEIRLRRITAEYEFD